MANFSGIGVFNIDNLNDHYNISSYFDVIDDYFVLNKIGATDNAYKKSLVRTVCGSALLQIIKLNKYDDLETYDLMKAAVIKHFSSQANPVIANIQFDKAKINSNETFENYIIRLKSMSSSCKFGDNSEQHILYKLIQEFPNTNAARECIKKQDSTLANFITFYTNERFQNTHLSALNS